MTQPSYTEANPVEFRLVCNTCHTTVSGDNLPDNLRALFVDHHEGHDIEEAEK